MRGDVVCFTIAQDEATWLPGWIRCYQPHARLVLYNHDSHDDTVAIAEAAGLEIHHVSHPVSCDWLWYMALANELQWAWLKRVRTVMFATADEWLLPARGVYRDLTEFLTRHPDDGIIHARGHHVIDCGVLRSAAHPTAPLDLTRPILRQRCCWIPDKSYDKPLILRQPVEWVWGFHSAWEVGAPPHRAIPPAPDPHLYLAHLHRADWALCQARHAAIQRRPLAPAIHPTEHDYTRTGEAAWEWFAQGATAYREAIPAAVKDAA